MMVSQAHRHPALRHPNRRSRASVQPQRARRNTKQTFRDSTAIPRASSVSAFTPSNQQAAAHRVPPLHLHAIVRVAWGLFSFLHFRGGRFCYASSRSFISYGDARTGSGFGSSLSLGLELWFTSL